MGYHLWGIEGESSSSASKTKYTALKYTYASSHYICRSTHFKKFPNLENFYSKHKTEEAVTFLVLIIVIKHNQQFRGFALFGFHVSISQAGAEPGIMEEHCLLACSFCFLIGLSAQWWYHPQWARHFLKLTIEMKMPHRHVHKPI